MSALSALLVAAGTATACTIAPEKAPDTTLATLGTAALADAHVLQETRPDLAAISQRQADAFFGEAARLCGTDKDGQVIDSCAPTRPDEAQVAAAAESITGTSEEILAQAAARIADHSAAVDASSMPLISRIYAEDVVLSGTPGELPTESLVNDPADLQSAKDALSFVYGVDYGLTVAEAYSELGLKEQIATAIARQHDTEGSLVAAITAAPGVTDLDVPSPAAGYTFSEYPTPTDTASSLAMAETAHVNEVLLWYRLAAEAKNPAWRRYCLISAGRAAIAAGPFVDATGVRVWEADYLHYPIPSAASADTSGNASTVTSTAPAE